MRTSLIFNFWASPPAGATSSQVVVQKEDGASEAQPLDVPLPHTWQHAPPVDLDCSGGEHGVQEVLFSVGSLSAPLLLHVPALTRRPNNGVEVVRYAKEQLVVPSLPSTS